MTADAVRGFFDDLMNSRFEELEARMADDIVFEFPGRRFGGRWEGKRRVMRFFRANQTLFLEGLKFHVWWVAVMGDRAVGQWTNAGVTREGVSYENRGVTVFRFAEERIVEIQDYLDTERVAETWPPKAARVAHLEESKP